MFQVAKAPLSYLYCHCRSCRKTTGSVHAANIAFAKDALEWVQGEDLVQRYVDQTENPGYSRWFCKNCGSFVPCLTRKQDFWVVPSGLLDEDPGIRPSAQIFWEEHVPWGAAVESLPKHDGGGPYRKNV